MAYPDSMKKEALELREQGLSLREISAALLIPSRMTVWRWVHDPHDGPDVAPGKFKERHAMKLPKVEGDGPTYPDIDPNDKDALIDRLQLENDILRGMNEILKGVSLSQATNREKTLLIEWLRPKTGRRLRELTDSLRISKSSYEYQRAVIARGDRYAWLRPLVDEEFQAEKQARGYRVITLRLRERDEPVRVSEKVVRTIMREGKLQVKRKRVRHYSSYAGEPDAAPDNLLLCEDGSHDFHAAAPNEKWVTDITEFLLPDKLKVYLSPVLDLFDGKPVGWAISRHPDAWLANTSLVRACSQLEEGQHPCCHSDRGSHYFWPSWKNLCKGFGITRSMSRKGHTPDNAAMEGFFGRLKNEFFYGRDWAGVSFERFASELDAWMRAYSETRVKMFREGGKLVYDTIDNRRRRLGYTA